MNSVNYQIQNKDQNRVHSCNCYDFFVNYNQGNTPIPNYVVSDKPQLFDLKAKRIKAIITLGFILTVEQVSDAVIVEGVTTSYVSTTPFSNIPIFITLFGQTLMCKANQYNEFEIDSHRWQDIQEINLV